MWSYSETLDAGAILSGELYVRPLPPNTLYADSKVGVPRERLYYYQDLPTHMVMVLPWNGIPFKSIGELFLREAYRSWGTFET